MARPRWHATRVAHGLNFGTPTMATTRLGSLRRSRYAVTDGLDEAAATALVQRALAGGAEIDKAGVGRARSVLWSDFGDEALVHLDSVRLRFVKRFAVVSVDLETEQTGRAALVVTLALGSTQDGAGLVAATDALPRGNAMLASRWGRVLQETVWSALLDLARQHADERGQVPLAMHVLDGHLRFNATPALALGEAALKTFDATFPGERAARAARRATR